MAWIKPSTIRAASFALQDHLAHDETCCWSTLNAPLIVPRVQPESPNLYRKQAQKSPGYLQLCQDFHTGFFVNLRLGADCCAQQTGIGHVIVEALLTASTQGVNE
jgi:hypothetical protein